MALHFPTPLVPLEPPQEREKKDSAVKVRAGRGKIGCHMTFQLARIGREDLRRGSALKMLGGTGGGKGESPAKGCIPRVAYQGFAYQGLHTGKGLA